MFPFACGSPYVSNQTVAAPAVQHSVSPGACEQSGTATDNIFALVRSGEQKNLNSSGMCFDPQEINDEF